MAPTDVHWSLDGRYLAYLSWDMTFPVQPPVLVIYTVEGDLVRAHSFPEDMTIQVYWSPDSRYLAYLAHGASAPQAGNIGLGFFDMDAPTDDAHNLLPVGETVNFLDTTSGGWSYDARYFAFEGRDDRDQHKTLLAATLDGEIVRLPRPVTTSDVVYMWSPTDSRIAYDTPTQTLDIYDMDAGQVVAQVDAGPTAALSPVGWLPDGRSLLYRWFDGAYVQSATFYIALFDGQTQVDLLTQVGVPNLTLTVGQSPVLLANNVVYRLTDDNNRAERLSGTEVLDIAYAAWSPDGEQLLLTSLFQNIYLLDTNDAAPSVRLLPFRPSATNFAYWHNFAGESD
jgi:Tol biopolymer transport system component